MHFGLQHHIPSSHLTLCSALIYYSVYVCTALSIRDHQKADDITNGFIALLILTTGARIDVVWLVYYYSPL